MFFFSLYAVVQCTYSKYIKNIILLKKIKYTFFIYMY